MWWSVSLFKMTIYLPEELKRGVRRIAAETGRSQADIIRDGIRLAIAEYAPPPPTIPIYFSDEPHFGERVNEHLSGFGQP
jgi:hypothetical protein